MGKTVKKIKKFLGEKLAPITGGNLFETETTLRTQSEINNASLITTDMVNNSVKSVLQAINENKITQRIFNEYVLLNLQANYFCGTCEFETDNYFIKRLLMQTIRGAFMFGVSGIYKDKLNNIRSVYITNLNYGLDSKITSCKVYPLDVMLTALNTSKEPINENNYNFELLDKNDCENLAVFQWGVMGFSAWITIYPFVKLQHSLLKMIIAQSYIYMKKLGYRVENPDTVFDELTTFFDENNPFIITSNLTTNLANRFNVEQMQTDFSGSDFIEYYEKTIYAFYHLLGRRINNDVKKERNVTNEVDASQENYDVIQDDWLKYFDIFIDKLNELVPDANVKKRNEIIKEREQNEQTNWDNRQEPDQANSNN